MRVAAAQLLLLVLYRGFALATTLGFLHKGFSKPAMRVRVFWGFFFLLVLFSTYRALCKASQASWPSNHSPSWWPGAPWTATTLPAPQPSQEQIGCLHLHLAFSRQRYFFHMCHSPSDLCWLLPRLSTPCCVATAKQEPLPVSMVCSLPTHADAASVTRCPWEAPWLEPAQPWGEHRGEASPATAKIPCYVYPKGLLS